MAKIAADECPAGPAMDAAVAEALGVEFPTSIEYDDKDEPRYYHGDGMWGDRVAHYSTDIAAAWKLVESIRKDTSYGLMLLLFEPEFFDKEQGWCVDILSEVDSTISSSYAGYAPLAICRAFLKANGVEFVEVLE